MQLRNIDAKGNEKRTLGDRLFFRGEGENPDGLESVSSGKRNNLYFAMKTVLKDGPNLLNAPPLKQCK